ncbi:hypothetical protein [Cryptosporangium minutisporangium]|uniref:Uncharacterized protein n=1 Tax=Cryptosporangium minutisporangium TaxID=113569 RepID=A0ABP6SW02_9ACTN
MSNAVLEPPPERDFPPGRHLAMRDEILRDIADARRHRTRGPRALDLRRLLTPVVAAAGVLAVMGIAVTVIALPSLDNTAPSLDRPTSQPASAEVIPGFTAAQLTTLELSCVAGMKAGHKNLGVLDRKPAREVLDLDSLRILNAVTGGGSTLAILGNADTVATCSWKSVDNGSPMPSAAPLQHTDYILNAGWLPEKVTQDAGTGSHLKQSKIAYQTVGRVTPDVAEVELSMADGTVRVPVFDGTFAANVVFTENTVAWPDTVVRAYDRNGRLLGEYPRAGAPDCAVDPSGNVVDGRGVDDPTKCVEARPWR